MLLISPHIIDIDVLKLNVYSFILFNYQLYCLLIIIEDPLY